VGNAKVDEVTQSGHKRRRVPVAIIVASVLLFLQVALFIILGIGGLFLVGLLGSSPTADFTAGGTLTSSGTILLVSGLVLALGALGITVILGLILRWRWAWAAAMTWAALSLALGLVYYLRGQPEYLSMLGAVVLMLVLNQASVQRAFSPEVAPAGPPKPTRQGDTLSAPTGASDLELLRAFEPVLRFTKGERFYPTDVERYVSRSSLWVRRPDGTEEVLAKRGELDMDTLVRHRDYPFGAVEFLRFNEDLSVAESARVLSEASRLRRQEDSVFHPGVGRLARAGFVPRVADALFSLSLLLRGSVPRVTAAAAELEYHRMMLEDQKHVYYGRVVRRGGWTVLQYWFFYCYNSWRSGYEGANDHESDWENILIYLYEEDGRLHPEWTGYASHDYHGDDLRRRWDDSEQLDLAEGHPVVWAGAGSHASYFQQGDYQAKVALPVPAWIRSVARGLNYVWTHLLGQAGRASDPLRIPFVDYARGDGRGIGPGQEYGWDPVVIDESTPWVSRYRGLWGFFPNDPVSGENAPAGPMYERSGEPRRTWYDPLGFVGLDKEPPPPAASGLLGEDSARIQLRQSELEERIGHGLSELHAVGVEMTGMEGNPNLRARYQRLMERTVTLRDELQSLQKELTENQAVLGALQQKLTDLQEGRKSHPQAHIQKLAQPVPQAGIRFNRAAEAWGAVSLSLMLLGVVALLVAARDRLWIGLLVMGGAVVLLESILRGHYLRTVVGIAAILAVISAILLVFHFWLWIIVVLLAALAVFLMVQKLRELRS
jgi:hypothetical protein